MTLVKLKNADAFFPRSSPEDFSKSKKCYAIRSKTTVFSCFGSDDPQNSPPRGSDESETSIRRLRMRRAVGFSNLLEVEDFL
jgi:hypothetical protein